MLVVVLSVLTSKPQTDAWFWFVLERITDLYLDTLSMSNVRPPQTLLKNPRVLWVVESNFLKLCETNLWQILNHLSPFVNLAKVIPISLWHIMSGPAAQSSWITQHFIYFTWLKATYPYQCYYAYRYQHVVRIVFTIMECHFNQHWIHK